MTMKEKLAAAVEMAKQGAMRKSIMQKTGLSREQVDEIKRRVKA